MNSVDVVGKIGAGSCFGCLGPTVAPKHWPSPLSHGLIQRHWRVRATETVLASAPVTSRRASAAPVRLERAVRRAEGAVGSAAGAVVALQARRLLGGDFDARWRFLSFGRRPAPGGDRHRLGHEIPPDERRQLAARHLVHRRLVVVADPNADDERLVEADEPGVAIILARAGLPGRKAVERGGPPRSPVDDQFQQADERLLVGLQLAFGRDGRAELEHARLLVGPESRDPPRLHRRRAGAHRRIGAGQVDEAHLRGAERQARAFRKRSVDAEVARRRDHLVDADFQSEADGRRVQRARKSFRQAHPAVIAFAEILRLPALDLERSVLDPVARREAVAQAPRSRRRA